MEQRRGVVGSTAARLLTAGVVVVTLSVLTGCDSTAPDEPAPTDQERPSDVESTPAVTYPACASVWVKGLVLPEDYIGCTSDDELVPASGVDCGDDELLVLYGEHLYAFPGWAIRYKKNDDSIRFREVGLICFSGQDS